MKSHLHLVKRVARRTENPSLFMPSCFVGECPSPAEISFLKQPCNDSDRADANAECLIPRELTLLGFGGEQGIGEQPRVRATPAVLLSSLTSWKIVLTTSEGALSRGLCGA